jgi:hypothetical protein
MHGEQSQLPRPLLSIAKSVDFRSNQLLSTAEYSHLTPHESISNFVTERLRESLQTSLKNQQTKVFYNLENVSDQKPLKALRQSGPMWDLEWAN